MLLVSDLNLKQYSQHSLRAKREAIGLVGLKQLVVIKLVFLDAQMFERFLFEVVRTGRNNFSAGMAAWLCWTLWSIDSLAMMVSLVMMVSQFR